ncbi:MAG: leucyl aminopeptidase family protein, partial [Devosia sp.]|nr:leucyl aminopeptidase family protein [Devosia sp.]
MPVELLDQPTTTSRPVYLVAHNQQAASGLDQSVLNWMEANDFTGAAGSSLMVPGANGAIVAAVLGTGERKVGLAAGSLAKLLPEGDWHLASEPGDANQAALGLVLGGYAFTRYGKKVGRALRLSVPGADTAKARRIADGVFLARDLVNTPTNDMG